MVRCYTLATAAVAATAAIIVVLDRVLAMTKQLNYQALSNTHTHSKRASEYSQYILELLRLASFVESKRERMGPRQAARSTWSHTLHTA